MHSIEWVALLPTVLWMLWIQACYIIRKYAFPDAAILQAFARFFQQVIMCVDRLLICLVIWNEHVTKWQALLLFHGAFPSCFFSFFFIPSHEQLEVCPLSVRAPAGQCNKQINKAGLCTLISVAVPPTWSLRPTRQPRKWPPTPEGTV